MGAKELMEIMKTYNLDHGEAYIWGDYGDSVTVIADGPNHSYALIDEVPTTSEEDAKRAIAKGLKKHCATWRDVFNETIKYPEAVADLERQGLTIDDQYRQTAEDAKFFDKVANRLLHEVKA